MRKKRIIPLVLFRNGAIVQAREFRDYRQIGLLGPTLRRFSDWQADELCLVDISTETFSVGRRDVRNDQSSTFLEALRDYSHVGTMPLTVGGRLWDVDKARLLIRSGAEKVLLSSAVHKNPRLSREIAEEFGAQAVMVCLDYVSSEDGKAPRVIVDRKTMKHGATLSEFVEKLQEDESVGEIMVNCISRDGLKVGMDLDVITSLNGSKKPLIVCGGAGNARHFEEPLRMAHVDAVSASNLFQHIENSVPVTRDHLLAQGLNVRSVQ